MSVETGGQPPGGGPPTSAGQSPRSQPSTRAEREQRRQLRGSALLVVGRVASLLINMATQVVLVRILTKGDYGAFAYALTIANGGQVVLSLGQGKLLSRFMATYEEKRDYPRLFGAMFLAVGTVAATSTLTIGAMFLFSGALVGGAVDGRDAVHLVLILVFLAPLQALDQVFVSLFAVFSRPTAIFFRKFLLAPGLRLVAVLLCAVTGATVPVLAVCYVIAGAAGIAVYVALLVPVLRQRGLLQHLNMRRIIVPFREVFEFSFPLITGELALLSLTMGGVIVLAAYHSDVEVANYRAVFNPARLNTAVSGSLATLFLPVIARLRAREDFAGLRHSYWNTAAFVAVFTFPIFALTGPLAPVTTVTLFGARYAESGTILAILAVGYYMNAMLGFNAYTVQVCGRIRYLVGVNVAVFVVNIGLCFVLAPRFAAVGVAVANCVALVVQNVLNQWALRAAGVSAFIDRSCWRAYAMIAAGTGVLWAFQVLVSPGMVLALAAAVLVSGVVLVGSRKTLQVAETFPEIRRIPVLGKLVT